MIAYKCAKISNYLTASYVTNNVNQVVNQIQVQKPTLNSQVVNKNTVHHKKLYKKLTKTVK